MININKAISLLLILMSITIMSCKQEIKRPEPSEPLITFTFKPERQVESVYLAGEFNNWKVNDPSFVMSFSNGVYSIQVKKSLFKKGKNAYVFIVKGDWIPDPNATVTENRGVGGKVSILVIP